MTRILLCLALIACSATQRHTALNAATASIEAIDIGLVAYDDQRQTSIIAACSIADGKAACDAQLVAYRAKRAKLLLQIKTTLEAIRDAWKLDNGPSAATALALAAAVEKAVEGFR